MHGNLYSALFILGCSKTHYSENKNNYSKSHTDHLYSSTTSLYRPAFNIKEIIRTIPCLCFGKFYKPATSLNGPHAFTPRNGRFREVLLYTKHANTVQIEVSQVF